jgi:uncharacterized protein (TIGR00369 family)
MTTDLSPIELTKIRAQAHSNCVVCSPLNKRGFGLEFMISKDGSVQATFGCDKVFEGYANVLHGGVISCLLDGAMTNCMFAHGYVAVTAELDVRFQHPVVTGELATVRAWIDRSRSRLHVVKAEFTQNGQVKATAVGKFMKQPLPTRSDEEPKRER